MNTEANGDLFGYANVKLEDVDKIMVGEEQHRWPEVLRELYSALKSELENHGSDGHLAVALIYRITKDFGGMQFYLPRAKHIECEIQNLSIWHDFNGKNVVELSKKYDKCEQYIYRVIAKMRAREVKMRQQDLF
ncbi:transcriptional regulator [Vibrio parahaemolyticus]|uniref:Transcriptional regulator n=1 Tax=Vibrio parahaemolyticus TaxID=670 RepID=A0A8H9MUY9_VIBPH|nr:transcriptional regulator [Vibrio parahaemolyticus]UJX09655.1 transcriptional regulator [Vibrio parahaemolyticus]HAS6672756.1 transcriptional regulator [Vibrio parahaemolyticus]HAS6674855.1 transcriptional regulator [Vibrio parahaemolyticus]HAS6678609.1 transcriptional regulator [Vibrio parahaemolyticus]